MANPISRSVALGTIGELLVQLRLLEYGIQAAPPIKDSGNDLIAVKGEIVKFIQIKTITNGHFSLSRLPSIYHLVALVELAFDGEKIALDRSKIWLLIKGQRLNQKRELTQTLVDEIWFS